MKSKSKILLLVFVHGNNGDPSDWNIMINTLKTKIANQVDELNEIMLYPYKGRKYLHNIDTTGKQLTDEITNHIIKEMYQYDMIEIYFICHSLGGLIVRYALPSIEGILHRESKSHCTIIGYCSIVTPHAGIIYGGFSLANIILLNFYGPLGHELEIIDNDKLLIKMADLDDIWMKSLIKIKYLMVITSPFDVIVPYYSSSLNLHSHSEHEINYDNDLLIINYINFDEDYIKIFEQFFVPDIKTQNHKVTSRQQSIIDNLNTLKFRKLNVYMNLQMKLMIHDSFIKKRTRGILPHGGKSSDIFISIFTDIILLDILYIENKFEHT